MPTSIYLHKIDELFFIASTVTCKIFILASIYVINRPKTQDLSEISFL